MGSRLIDLLPRGLQDRDSTGNIDRHSRLRGRLLLGVPQACLALCALSLATSPLSPVALLSEEAGALSFAAALLLGTGLLLLAARRYGERLCTFCACGAAILQAAAAISAAFALASPAHAPIALLTALMCSGAAIPVALLFWSALFARFPRGDVFLTSSAGFILFALLFALLKLFPFTLPTAFLASAVLSAAMLCAVYLSMQRGKVPSSTEANLPPESQEDSATSSPLGRLFFSVPFLGLALCVFTAGAVARDTNSSIGFLPSILGAVAAVIAAVTFFVANRRARTTSQLFFLLFDLGLPGCAVIAFAIKMIPLELISTVAFPRFMEAYFLILVASFWISLVLFGRSNSSQLSAACAIASTGCAGSLTVGFISSLFGTESRGVVLGLVTALFLILTIVAVGYSLILYAKGSETAEELAPTPEAPNLADICKAFGESHQLTPREIEVLVELAYGHSSSYIAKVLFISSNTARSHMKNIYKKLGVGSREELIEVLREKQGGA